MVQPAVPTGRFALFLDVDGTLIDIAPSPDAVVVPNRLIEDLRRVDRRLGGAVALVSGRRIADLDRLFQPLRLRASGVHGAEFRFEPGREETIALAHALPPDLWRELLGLLAAFPGTMAENKDYSFAVHYRAAPACGPALGTALSALVAALGDPSLRVMPGHCVFEIKRRDVDKGAAVERFLGRTEFRDRRPIFIGDDVTDWPGFATALARGGLAYAVGDTAAEVTGSFLGPEAVRTWLGQISLDEAVNA